MSTNTISRATLVRAHTALEMYAMDLRSKHGSPWADSYADSAKQLQRAIDNVDRKVNLVQLKPHS